MGAGEPVEFWWLPNPHPLFIRRHLRTAGQPSGVKRHAGCGTAVCVRLEVIAADLRLMVETDSSFEESYPFCKFAARLRRVKNSTTEEVILA